MTHELYRPVRTVRHATCDLKRDLGEKGKKRAHVYELVFETLHRKLITLSDDMHTLYDVALHHSSNWKAIEKTELKHFCNTNQTKNQLNNNLNVLSNSYRLDDLVLIR